MTSLTPRQQIRIGAAVIALLAAASPAHADYCVRLTGGSFSGDIGFFRIAGSKPTTAGEIKAIVGRAAGLSPLFGTAVVAKDGSYIELGATFFIDGTEGQFDVAFSPLSATSGSGHAEYGSYGVNTSVTAKFVRCSGEP